MPSMMGSYKSTSTYYTKGKLAYPAESGPIKTKDAWGHMTKHGGASYNRMGGSRGGGAYSKGMKGGMKYDSEYKM